jgi:hypothetical protein
MIRQRKARQVNIRQGKAMQRNATQGNKKGKERQGEAIIKTRQGNARQRKGKASFILNIKMANNIKNERIWNF